jgi:hypothetical protein
MRLYPIRSTGSRKRAPGPRKLDLDGPGFKFSVLSEFRALASPLAPPIAGAGGRLTWGLVAPPGQFSSTENFRQLASKYRRRLR